MDGLKFFYVYCRYKLLAYESSRRPENINSDNLFVWIIYHVIVSVILILMSAHAHFIKQVLVPLNMRLLHFLSFFSL